MGPNRLLAVASSVVGLYLSFWLDVASGATIVLVQTALFLAILALSPRTGLLRRRRRAVLNAPAQESAEA